MNSAPSGVLVQRSDSISQALRRLFIVVLMLIVGGTWFAVAEYSRAHRRQETADEKAVQCDLIEEQGEDYYGELAECRNRVAYLRMVERH